MAHVAVNTPSHAAPAGVTPTWFDGLRARFTRYQAYRTTKSELEALSDRELEDLGLSRAMIRRIAYHAAYS